MGTRFETFAAGATRHDTPVDYALAHRSLGPIGRPAAVRSQHEIDRELELTDTMAVELAPFAADTLSLRGRDTLTSWSEVAPMLEDPTAKQKSATMLSAVLDKKPELQRAVALQRYYPAAAKLATLIEPTNPQRALELYRTGSMRTTKTVGALVVDRMRMRPSAAREALRELEEAQSLAAFRAAAIGKLPPA